MRKTVAALVGALLLAAACSSSGGWRPAPAGTSVGERIGSAVQLIADVRPAVPQAAAARPVVAAEQRFTLALLRRLHSSTNVTVSPSSLAIALTMLENGASGATRDQIAHALGAGSLSMQQQNAGWRALTAQWSQTARSDHFALHSANAVWAEQGFPVRPRYLTALGKYFATGLWRTDFAGHNAAALKAINDWTKQQTHGKIAKLFDQLDSRTKVVLANAVYFNAQWATKFGTRLTQDGLFATASGSSVTVPMMHSFALTTPAATGAGYTAVELPYKGGRFAALAIMPTSGSLSTFTASLSEQRLRQIAYSLRRRPVSLSMPRFTTTSTLDLPSTLQTLGIHDAFGPGADLSPMSPVARHIGLHVGQVVQRDYLSVTEAGTEAAAATGVQAVPLSLPATTPITLDHPFLFLVRDVQSGALLFASEVNDPSAG